jgi:hypothetical protein
METSAEDGWHEGQWGHSGTLRGAAGRPAEGAVDRLEAHPDPACPSGRCGRDGHCDHFDHVRCLVYAR